MNRIFLLCLALISLQLASCSKDPEDEIQDYLDKNNLVAQKTDEGLYYIIEIPGNDTKPKVNSDIRVKYKGTLTNGTVFDENEDFEVNLSNVIAGWRRGMVLFGEGGKGKLLIPPSLGYGDQQVGSIPPNSVLIFDVELLEVL
ncbi:MAG TPA: FKBP-type peptidyl-prolyl cis-trans isomerase [Saprospiraceae bacterium]|nr:FKBP-type peptidyl-prolyl cis-trans isomerase [Saprospiraceae bacterium]HRG65075.1 FKBP-type peptidyl-prolyl cis-trans isomerase [Saprospiraceae bacterium]